VVIIRCIAGFFVSIPVTDGDYQDECEYRYDDDKRQGAGEEEQVALLIANLTFRIKDGDGVAVDQSVAEQAENDGSNADADEYFFHPFVSMIVIYSRRST